MLIHKHQNLQSQSHNELVAWRRLANAVDLGTLMPGVRVKLAFSRLSPPRSARPPSPSRIKFCHEIRETLS